MILLMIGATLALSLVMLTGWSVQRALNNGGWTDVFWTLGMGLAGAGAALMSAEAPGALATRQVLVASLIGLWALRLGFHIVWRVLISHEDARYAAFRTEWGQHFQRNMLIFLQIQALAGGVLLIAVIAAAHNPAAFLRPQDAAGALIILIAVAGETIADRQLRAFAAKPDNKGKVCDSGLWAWSRHPNYFFEWLSWLAYPLIAIDLSGGYVWGWAALVAPVYMYWLLRYVSGVPPLEAHMLRSRGEVFAAYQARTSVFFPLPPRQAAQAKP